MLCTHCIDAIRQKQAQRDAAAEPPKALGEDRLRALLCARCGALLPARDATDTFLDTLSALARFGLTSEARPVLARIEEN
jgi:hypothetical protein